MNDITPLNVETADRHVTITLDWADALFLETALSDAVKRNEYLLDEVFDKETGRVLRANTQHRLDWAESLRDRVKWAESLRDRVRIARDKIDEQKKRNSP